MEKNKQKKTKVNLPWRLIILFVYIILGVSLQNYLSELGILTFILGFFAMFAWVCVGALNQSFEEGPQNKLNSRKE